MKERMTIKRILLLCLAACLLLPGTAAAQEGYAMSMGEVRIYLDHDLTRLYGTLGDSSVVYVVQSQETARGGVYTLIFGVDGVLRLGYAAAADMVPLGAMEAEMYEAGAQNALLYNGRIRLLNCAFALYGVTAAPTAAPTPEPTPAPVLTPAVEGAAAELTPLPHVTAYVKPTAAPNGITILIEPEDVYAFNGEEFILSVAAEGAVSFRWQYFDGEGWTDSVMSQAGQPAMKLVAFTGGRDRIYRCVLTARDGSTVCTREVHIFVQ